MSYFFAYVAGIITTIVFGYFTLKDYITFVSRSDEVQDSTQPTPQDLMGMIYVKEQTVICLAKLFLYSVKDITYLHKVRYSGLTVGQKQILTPDTLFQVETFANELVRNTFKKNDREKKN